MSNRSKRKKGKHDYCAVLVELDKSELLRILPSITKEVLDSELDKWGDKVLDNEEKEKQREIIKNSKYLFFLINKLTKKEK